jgi:hypothetical protein
MHRFEAERTMRGYAQHDIQSIRHKADVFAPDIPAHQNAEYVARVKMVVTEHSEFFERADVGWKPPKDALLGPVELSEDD